MTVQRNTPVAAKLECAEDGSSGQPAEALENHIVKPFGINITSYVSVLLPVGDTPPIDYRHPSCQRRDRLDFDIDLTTREQFRATAARQHQ